VSVSFIFLSWSEANIPRALSSIQASIGVAPAAAAPEDDVEMESQESVLPAEVEANIVETNQS
jgi:hypothetical protein